MPEISVDLWSILILVGTVQGIVLSVLLLMNNGERVSNKILAAIIVLIVWMQLEFLSVRTVEHLNFNLFYGTRHASWLALGPLFYVYILSFTTNQFRLRKRHLLHFLPFLLFTLLIPALFAEAIPPRGKDYGMLTVIKFSKMGLTPLQMIYGYLFFLQFIISSIYALYGVKTLDAFKVKQARFDSMVLSARFKWMKNCALIFAVILASSFLYFIVLFYADFYQRWMDYFYIFPATVMIYFLAFHAYKNPYLFRDDLKYALSQKKYAKSPLNGRLTNQYKTRLLEYLEAEKAYRDADIRLTDLADSLQIPVHHLSQILNEQFQCNFNEFINQYRIAEAKKMLKANPSQQTILEIAYSVGFNNKASFYNYFKKITSMTPTQYRKEG